VIEGGWILGFSAGTVQAENDEEREKRREEVGDEE
jgi:hypothetical protein